MNDARLLLAKSLEISEFDKEKLENIYQKLFSSLLRYVERTKKTEINISDETAHSIPMKELNEYVKRNFPENNLKQLIETRMKPFLEEKGFKIITFSPSYSVTLSWK